MNLSKLTSQETELLKKYSIDYENLVQEDLKKQIRDQISKLKTQNAELESQKTDFETFYPTQIMTSAWEIFYAWIIRMILTGKYFTGVIPFEKYFCHAWVLDENGKKMSKSLGNVVDPSTEISKYSSDAVRLSLLAGSVPGKNLRYQPKNTEKYRNFITKVVNVAKFLEYQSEQNN